MIERLQRDTSSALSLYSNETIMSSEEEEAEALQRFVLVSSHGVSVPRSSIYDFITTRGKKETIRESQIRKAQTDRRTQTLEDIAWPWSVV